MSVSCPFLPNRFLNSDLQREQEKGSGSTASSLYLQGYMVKRGGAQGQLQAVYILRDIYGKERELWSHLAWDQIRAVIWEAVPLGLVISTC